MDIKIFFNFSQLFLDDANLPNVKMHFQSYGSPFLLQFVLQLLPYHILFLNYPDSNDSFHEWVV